MTVTVTVTGGGPLSLARVLQEQPGPILALAPMQDVTDLAFWRVMHAYGGPDVYFTEYFRVYPNSSLDRTILSSIIENTTGRPVVAQLIGNDIPSLTRSALELQRHAIAAVDLNLGCPAPVVYRKCAGGGLLRELKLVDAILGALRAAVSCPLTVKTRIGFEDTEPFEGLLDVLASHRLDLVTVHGRTVREMYRSEVHYDFIARAVSRLPCPVLANGNVYSARKGAEVLATTGARGLMIGRGAIRNPWIFEQFRSLQRGEPILQPTGREVFRYLEVLFEGMRSPILTERSHVQRIKKHLNYVGIGLEPTGAFLHRVRRATAEPELFAIFRDYLDHDEPLALEPYALALNTCDVMAGEHL